MKSGTHLKWYISFVSLAVLLLASFRNENTESAYKTKYFETIETLENESEELITFVRSGNGILTESSKDSVRHKIHKARMAMKRADFWTRYFEPVVYKKINGPLPVEWETEVFEKYEKPYRRVGAGLTLAELYLDETNVENAKLQELLNPLTQAIQTYKADSIAKNIQTFDHFYTCNRLFLLNLASIYTTGFECPDTHQILPELRYMLEGVKGIYSEFQLSFPKKKLSDAYIKLYDSMTVFVHSQSPHFSSFNHFEFIRNYVSPLFTINQKMILDYQVRSRSLLDYSLNKEAIAVFDKELYTAQNAKGVFLRVTNPEVLSEIDRLGKMLFYDPILSGNMRRSCVSCHKSGEYFTDTVLRTSLQFDGISSLNRNTPSLINVGANHLIMLDGKHLNLQEQVKAVISNPSEMGADLKQVLKNILTCKDYKNILKKLLPYTPQEPEISIEHIASAITFYYAKFSKGYSPFDRAMNRFTSADKNVVAGFNLFMSKAQCGTCHFPPYFNGVKPPYIGSEFEVLGVPADTGFLQFSVDSGRYFINPAQETFRAFRTGTIRNASFTGPYMHNGVFKSLREVVVFYNNGGGNGRGLQSENQTLNGDKLGLSNKEIDLILEFIRSLNEDIPFEAEPEKLPKSSNKKLNSRKVGGEY